MSDAPVQPPPHVLLTCPLSTDRLVEAVLAFVDMYNEPANIHLYSYQRVFMHRLISSLLNHDGAILTGLWSRQSGKSEALASVTSALCIFLPALAKAFPDDPRLMQYKEGLWVGIFAPRLQQSGYIYERIRNRASRQSSVEIYNDPDINVFLTRSRGDQVSWSNGSFVLSQTASEQSNVEGGTYHLIIIDEAQLVGRSKIDKEIRPQLAATNGTMAMIGTANAQVGSFRDTIIYNIRVEQETGERNHFEFPYDVVIKEKRAKYDKEKAAYEAGESTKPPLEFHLNYEKFVEKELEKLGGNIDNPEFRMNFRLLWQDSGEKAFPPGSSFDFSGDETLDANVPNYSTRQVAGLDFARKRDATILTVMEVDENPVYDPRALVRNEDDDTEFFNKRIIAWYEAEGTRWNDILGAVVSFLAEYNVDTLVVDGTGIGDPLAEQLQSLLPDIKVVPYIMSTRGNDYAYKLYIQEMDAGRIKYAASPATKALRTYQRFVYEHEILILHRDGPRIQCKAPEGEHDDYPDSAALACIAASSPREAEVESTLHPRYADAWGSRRQRYASRADRYRR